jgi:hypothetical protein
MVLCFFFNLFPSVSLLLMFISSFSLRRNLNVRTYDLPFEIIEKMRLLLKSLMGAVKRSKNPRLLVLIDEYDLFAKLMLENIAAYDGVLLRQSEPSTRLSRRVSQG